jgi:hypothetical protein
VTSGVKKQLNKMKRELKERIKNASDDRVYVQLNWQLLKVIEELSKLHDKSSQEDASGLNIDRITKFKKAYSNLKSLGYCLSEQDFKIIKTQIIEERIIEDNSHFERDYRWIYKSGEFDVTETEGGDYYAWIGEDYLWVKSGG